METTTNEIEEEMKNLCISMSSHVLKNDIGERICLPVENTQVVNSDRSNALPLQKIDDIDQVYAFITRFMLFDTISLSHIPPLLKSFLNEMENNELYQATKMKRILDLEFFGHKFRSLIKADTESLNLSSDIEWAEFFLSRSVIFYAEPTYFSFMLVASFLNYALSFCFMDQTCFRILYIIEFCFDVLYRRIFWQFFKSQDDYEKLLLCWDAFNDYMESEPTGSKLNPTFYEENWLNYVKNSVNITGDGFSLTESERELFKKFYSPECVGDISSELDQFLMDTLESYPQFKFHRDSCCGSKCYNYFAYAIQFPWS
ncbi:hypothetical protein NPIL_13841 [Nephila pilipes]|uniref:Uncharacterized protein n=1 Tax=Nephila pilipes TaxID=299642 RepID=A0A8X6PZM1_NEPPI|nr:hypothetical protein NPIL_13841 [Nephila pilipes]